MWFCLAENSAIDCFDCLRAVRSIGHRLFRLPKDDAIDCVWCVCVRKRDSAELGVSRCASAAERCKVAAISLDYCKPAASAVYVDCQSGMLCWIIP